MIGLLYIVAEPELSPSSGSFAQGSRWNEQKTLPSMHGNHQPLERRLSLNVFKQKMKNNLVAMLHREIREPDWFIVPGICIFSLFYTGRE